MKILCPQDIEAVVVVCAVAVGTFRKVVLVGSSLELHSTLKKNKQQDELNETQKCLS